MRQVSKRKHKGQKIQLDQIDVREVLDDLEIDYKTSGKNVGLEWIGVNCPFCGDDTGHHLGINLRSPVISCFRCGKTGNILTYLAEELQDFGKALDVLGDAVPYELREFKGKENENKVSKVILPKGSTRPNKWHKRYLKKRKFKIQDLEDLYPVLYCGPIGEWCNRIIVPVIRRYKVITFTSIDICDESFLRYKHLSDDLSILPIKKHLLGLEHTNGHTAMVVEGFFDHLRIGKGSVCTFGTKTTSEQKLLLSKFKRVILVGDGDKAGRKMNDELGYDLAAYTEVIKVNLPEGKDPDKLSKKDIKQLQNMLGTY